MARQVVVVGSGLAGMAAALTAAERGAEVTLIEKADSAMQSNTAFSGGGFGIHVTPFGDETPEEIVRGVVESSRGLCNVPLCEVLYGRMADDFQWLTGDLGLPVTAQPMAHPLGQGERTYRTAGMGAAIPPHLLPQAEHCGIQVLLNHPARKLLTDERGRVYGVRVAAPNGPRDFEGDAVILATGSFEANGAMVLQYCGPDIFNGSYQHLAGPTTHTGDGALMAMEAGAGFMRYPWLAHHGTVDHTKERGIANAQNTGGPIRSFALTRFWGLWVNEEGRRFVDESLRVDPIATAMARQPHAAAALVFDSAIRERLADEMSAYEARLPEGMYRADTIEDLAEQLRFPPRALRKTIDEYNAAVRPDGTALDLEVPKGVEAACAVRLDNPPYFAAYPVYAALNTIWGGFDVSPRMEVLDRDKVPIPGLYTAGSTFGGLFYGEWFQLPSGTWSYRGNHDYQCHSLPTCLVTGRMAGEAAATGGG